MTTAEMIPVKDIILDKGNPRIKMFLEMYKEVDETQMLLALGAGADEESGTTAKGSYDRLKHSIRASKGIIQPIILKQMGKDYLCIEGNTRVGIYRELQEEEQKAGQSGQRWETIPATIQDDMDEYEAHKIRLQVHLVGNRQWDPYSKAKYLHELLEDFKMPFSELVSFCGGSANEIQNWIKAYKDMETHYRPMIEDADGDFDPTRFSAFVELQKPGIKDSLYKNGYNEEDFSRWVDSKKIYPLYTVRHLPDILRDPEAKSAFLKEDARKALTTLEAPKLDTRLMEANIAQLTKALQEKINQLDYDDVQKIKSNTSSEEYLDLNDLFTSIKEILDEDTDQLS